MTALQWLAVAVGLTVVTLILGALVFYVFNREDRKQERRRNMNDHPSTQERRWDDQDNLS
jgi:cbb3-type cytochrome oxidase subunit 3